MTLTSCTGKISTREAHPRFWNLPKFPWLQTVSLVPRIAHCVWVGQPVLKERVNSSPHTTVLPPSLAPRLEVSVGQQLLENAIPFIEVAEVSNGFIKSTEITQDALPQARAATTATADESTQSSPFSEKLLS